MIHGIGYHNGVNYKSKQTPVGLGTSSISYNERKKMLQYFIIHYQVMESFKVEALEVINNPNVSNQEKIDWIEESLNNATSINEEAAIVADEL